MVIAAVNVGNNDYSVRLKVPLAMPNSSLYVYQENNRLADEDGLPLPIIKGLNVKGSYHVELKKQSFILLTNIN